MLEYTPVSLIYPTVKKTILQEKTPLKVEKLDVASDNYSNMIQIYNPYSFVMDAIKDIRFDFLNFLLLVYLIFLKG